MRLRAICCALKYGLLPSRLYEEHPHHGLSYLGHLRLNLAYAWRWLTLRESAEDREFERLVNHAPDRWFSVAAIEAEVARLLELEGIE